jgi:hypothetical protein
VGLLKTEQPNSNAANGGCDWNAGVPACMSAKHEKGSRDLRRAKFDVAEKRDVAGKDACVPVSSILDFRLKEK